MDDKKPAFGTNHFEELVFLLAGLVLFGAIVTRFFEYLDSLGGAAFLWSDFLNKLLPYWRLWEIMAVIIIVTCIIWAAHSYRKIMEVVEEENKIFPPIRGESLLEELVENLPPEERNEKWERVGKLINSNNAADWRLAILEADILLDETLRRSGFVGDGVGEMLKTIDKSDLLTLDHAWEAHKIRNQVAHGGSDFQLSEREARRVISLFESVFKELQVI